MVDAPFEKPGNANWVQCAKCDHWFHAAPSLLRMQNVNLICPGCGHTFPSSDAKKLIES